MDLYDYETFEEKLLYLAKQAKGTVSWPAEHRSNRDPLLLSGLWEKLFCL
jgi:hypothetical protein